ncbi:YoaK family protein [Sphingomonas pokkalii]|uniref:DUF1275 domain-containing protein n=1 Tax=Sphingomonas pokkalii TaxID=2175090 RepID=A0A2U0SA84_9SPHN|nr:YoaK family protein [Sphingomonas pokkalii]PVX28195.1 DUF1275 domain-containing protein [Sphingomonas pokkalii]
MQRTESPLIALAILLAALAGFVDALAFTSLGGFFASFMSGNSTRLGVGLGSGSPHDAAIAASLVMSFVAGVILSSVIVRARPRRHQPVVMAVVTLLLALAAGTAMVAPGPIVLLLMAGAMGAENGVFQRDGEVTIGLTYMTGSLVKMGQKLAAALMGDADRFGWVPYLALWLGFVSGVVIGAESQFRWGWNALWLAPIFAGILTLLLASMTRPQPVTAG